MTTTIEGSATIEGAPVVTALAPMNESLAVEQQREAGLNALARMGEAEFVERLRSLRLGLERFDMMMREVLTTGPGAGYDLMVVEGVEKPVFTQSAAEKTCFITRLAPSFTVERASGTVLDAPDVHYVVTCRLHLGNTGGPVVAEGVGSANSYEKKYRWRFGERKCPECGLVGALVKSKWKAKGGPFVGTMPFVCWKKKGGCGVEFGENDERITKQVLGMVQNPDPFDLDNTLLKMAKKRAFVDATKTATCASNRVTQDLEDGTPGTSEHKQLSDAILQRAVQLGFKTRGELWAIVKVATGRACANMDEFGKLTANELAKVLHQMPTVPDHEQPMVDDTTSQAEAEVELQTDPLNMHTEEYP